jgi:hypothetical protein
MYEHHHKIIIGVLARQPALEIENWEFRKLGKWGNGITGVWGNENTRVYRQTLMEYMAAVGAVQRVFELFGVGVLYQDCLVLLV